MDENEKVISIDILRINRKVPRKCVCDEHHIKYTVDTENREITCECGIVVDPFEAMEYLARKYDRINESHKALQEQRNSWLRQKPRSIIFKNLEQSDSKGTMLPVCPNCKVPFEFSKVVSFVNAEFFRTRQRSIKKELDEQ